MLHEKMFLFFVGGDLTESQQADLLRRAEEELNFLKTQR